LDSGLTFPLRILHVVGGLRRGGIETWLVRVLRKIDRGRFRMDFLVHTEERCDYDDEVRELGSRIIPCLRYRHPWIYRENFRRAVRGHGPYQIIHSHLHHFNGYVLYLASRSGIPVRIAHSHNDTVSLRSRAGLIRRAYLALMGYWIRCSATGGLAASRRAALSLFGSGWESDRRWRIFYYGIDPDLFRARPEEPSIRAELGIESSAFVIGHVGRFTEQKNHRFLIEVAAEVIGKDPAARFLLVGEGKLRPGIEREVNRRGLTGRVVFAGSRNDVPRLMREGMDAFILPSLFEGLGMVGVEAQAAGLSLLISDALPEEIEVVKPLVRRLSLKLPASVWAETLLSFRFSKPDITPERACRIVERSRFNIESCVEKLSAFYGDSWAAEKGEADA